MAERGLITLVNPSPVSVAPSGVSFYRRITVNNTGGAVTLGSLITGGIPSWATPNMPGQVSYPSRVNIAYEQSGTDFVRLTYDGRTTPTTSLGTLVPAEPNFLSIPCPQQLANDTAQGIKVIASVDGLHCQVWFEE